MKTRIQVMVQIESQVFIETDLDEAALDEIIANTPMMLHDLDEAGIYIDSEQLMDGIMSAEVTDICVVKAREVKP